MKCPKCGYLGFEAVDRCRNCGYDFSLNRDLPLPELPIRDDSARVETLEDLSLLDRPPELGAESSRGGASDSRRRFDRAQSTSAELSLFGAPVEDDEPLIARASPPRAPLAVRRATPDVPRARVQAPRARPVELALDLDAGPAPPGPAPRHLDAGAARMDRQGHEEDASLGARLAAVLADLAILGAVDALVLYLTLQTSGITLSELGTVPRGPLIAFLFVQNGGYFVVLTLGGQTLGKMMAGIRVVANGSGETLDLSRAILRTALCLVLAVPAGLGFLVAVFSRDHRGLQDRLAGTRIVRASAS